MALKSQERSVGISFFGMLTLIFITLKLTGFIHWSWLWVLVFTWAPLAAALVVVLVILIITGLIALFS